MTVFKKLGASCFKKRFVKLFRIVGNVIVLEMRICCVGSKFGGSGMWLVLVGVGGGPGWTVAGWFGCWFVSSLSFISAQHVFSFSIILFFGTAEIIFCYQQLFTPFTSV